MFAFILSTILGIAGIIPPEHFETWREIMTIELCFDFPVFITISLLISKFRKEENDD